MSTESNNSPLDPRVQIELEKLNTATDNINKYEVELDEAKCDFKRILAESETRIRQAAHKLGNSIDAAKPYYESRIYAAQLAKETQKAAGDYEKAKSIHAAAKEMVYLAEQGLGEKSTLDTACQEMLSHAASKVNQSQLEVTDTRNSLKMCQLKLEVANNRVSKLQSQLKQAIKASRFNEQKNCNLYDLPFYETRANYNGILKTQKLKINDLEHKVNEAKICYNDALKQLEKISEEIHQQRQKKQELLQQQQQQQQQQHETYKQLLDTTLPSTSISYQHFLCDIEAAEEYLEIPDKLSTQSSPIRQRHLDEHDCPHLLKDFEAALTFPKKINKNPNTDAVTSTGSIYKSASASVTRENIFPQAQLRGPYEINCLADNKGNVSPEASSSSTQNVAVNDQDIEQWTEIRLSHSDSTSSSYSNQSLLHDHAETNIIAQGDERSIHCSSSSSDEPKRKVTCTTIFHEESSNSNKKHSLTEWLTRSNSLKMNGRRQSLDLLIDASDKVKDVFSFGFQKVGRTLERRNSESEMNADSNSSATTISTISTGASNSVSNTSTPGDFFLFSRFEPKELLSDEQVENLLLKHTLDESGMIVVEELKTPLQTPNNKYNLSTLLI